MIPLWQKACAVVGVILIIIALVVYVNRERDINMGQILREYVIPSAEVTFVNFKNDNDPRNEIVIESNHIVDKSASFEDDNNYLSRDEELSIDQG